MKKNILLGVTGSIASFKACSLIGLFREKGYAVRCMMSRSAGRFITQLTLETLTGERVVRGMFRLSENSSPPHISLADEADVILVAPATADIIGKVSAGICDDILTSTVCAAGCPVVFAPAMNDKMFNNPIVREKIEHLRQNGYHFIDPAKGPLACGREGEGRLAPLERIVEETERVLGT
ncbi:MAG: phosphopantothenoylcysteine decarboxylase [Candidatus Makaraimicrobium thalassicum]|nr:MAG: phosphopantothenoylcysteine decarboxylase [Candidatus Omnitrophota bacterium]